MDMPKIKDIENYIVNLDIDSALKYLETLKINNNITLDKLYEKYSKKKAAIEKEQSRLKEMCRYEVEAHKMGFSLIAGVDEVGRGPLAGPVVTAAVILPYGLLIEGINDSKKLSEKQREALYEVIKEKAISFGVGIVSEKEIDELNILNATKKAMEISIAALMPQPDYILIDAVRLPTVKIEQTSIIKGDALSISIAAASIVAKVTRDRLIVELDNKYPEYGFAKHKGYGTPDHIEAINKYGICPIHRVSFTKNFV
jgi:ribonuclease HII